MTGNTVQLRPQHVRWWWAALFAAALFAVEYVFYVRSRAGQWADQVAFNAWSQWWPRTELATPARQFLDALPVLCGAMAVFFLLYRVIRDKRLLRAVVAVLAAGAAMAATQLLKHVILDRPDFNFGTAGNSFPSGHTTAAAASMGLMYLVSPPKLRPVVQVVTWIFATATGLATLVCGWHRPSDIAAGYLVVLFFMVAAAAVLQRIQPLAAEAPETAWSRSTGTASILAWLLVAAASFLLPHPHIAQVPQPLLLAYAALGILHVVAASVLSGLALRSVVLGPTRQG